jgi:hypothetical protein
MNFTCVLKYWELYYYTIKCALINFVFYQKQDYNFLQDYKTLSFIRFDKFKVKRNLLNLSISLKIK